MHIDDPKTQSTPRITFNSSINEWCITGNSYSSEAYLAFDLINNWLNENEDRLDICFFKFQMEFINTKTSKVLLELFLRLRKIEKNKQLKLNITWHHEKDDEDMKEVGEILFELADLPKNLISY